MVAVHAGFAAVAASLHATVAAVGGEKMTHLSTPPVPEVIGRSIDPHERSCGSTMPALVGLVTRAAMHRRGCEKMSAIGKSLVKGFWKGRDRGER